MEDKITDKIALVQNQSIVLKKVSESLGITDKILTEFTSRELNNSFESVKIGNQEWMVENLNVSHFRNGDPIFEAKTKEEWKNAGDNEIPAWCYYNNDPELGEKYGKLYNWYALNDQRGLAPAGWHAPLDIEWNELESILLYNLDCTDNVAKALSANTDWGLSSVLNAIGNDLSKNNSSGFSALPGGYRAEDGAFFNNNVYGYWWSSSDFNSNYAFYRDLSRNDNNILDSYEGDMCCGFSIRCLKD